jgi:hypothetical protein
MTVTWLICTTLLFQAPDAPAASSTGSDAAVAAASASTELNAAQRIAPAIQSSIRTNHERLEGAELSLSRTFLNAGVQKEEKVETPLPNGGKVVTFKSPEHKFAERAVVLEDRVRLDQGGGGAAPAITYWFDGIRWTESNTSTRRVSKLHQNQLGGRTLDPREAAGLDYRTSLATILSQPSLKNATVDSVDTVTRISTVANAGGQKLVVDFDSKYSMLPTRSQLFHLNGKLARDVAITYAWMEPRSAWALATIKELVYDESVDGLSTPEKWKQQLITMATCTLLDRQAAEKLLTPVQPAGYEVVDYTDPATLQQRRQRPAVSVVKAESPLKWFIVAHVVLAAVAAVYFWRRRFASAV